MPLQCKGQWRTCVVCPVVEVELYVMKKFGTWFFIALLLAACGKNDGFRQVGTYNPAPVTSAPPPNYSGGGYNGGGYSGGGGGYFQPQMPANQPNQFVPFLPIYHYMQRSPQLQYYWTTMWQQWQQYARSQNTNQYNFTRFWTDYCPQTMQQNMYGAFDNSFYYWVTPQTQISTSVDTSFWSDYSSYSYSSIDQYGYCSGCN